MTSQPSRIYISGASTLIGAALRRQVGRHESWQPIGDADEEPDLCDEAQVEVFMKREQPEYVVIASGRSGGIEANRRIPAELMRDNLLSTTHLIHAAWRHKVKTLLYLASSCCYPRECPQPMPEDALWSGAVEPTNKAYAAAKLSGIVLAQAYAQQYGANFITGIPANAFGLEDDFSPDESHVIPALIRKMHAANVNGESSVTIWGSGKPLREFIFADDLADACLFMLRQENPPEIVNLAGGTACTIAELATLVKEVVGYNGTLTFDSSYPDGMPLKVLDATKITKLGWRPATPFKVALRATYQEWLRASENTRAPAQVQGGVK